MQILENAIYVNVVNLVLYFTYCNNVTIFFEVLKSKMLTKSGEGYEFQLCGPMQLLHDKIRSAVSYIIFLRANILGCRVQNICRVNQALFRTLIC